MIYEDRHTILLLNRNIKIQFNHIKVEMRKNGKTSDESGLSERSQNAEGISGVNTGA